LVLLLVLLLLLLLLLLLGCPSQLAGSGTHQENLAAAHLRLLLRLLLLLLALLAPVLLYVQLCLAVPCYYLLLGLSSLPDLAAAAGHALELAQTQGSVNHWPCCYFALLGLQLSPSCGLGTDDLYWQ
jgi:hypothetical protein